MKILEIGGHKVSCNIITKDVKHAYLRLKPNFYLEIILPYKSKLDIDSILSKKYQWLERKVRELSNMTKIIDSDRILYKGNPLSVRVYPVKRSCKGIRLYKRVIFVYENSHSGKNETIRNFMATQTLNYVKWKAKIFARELGVTYCRIFTKDMKRWGKCTRDGNLFFNLRLIGLPEHLIDYIVFHELLHLKYFNHSKQFRRLLAKYFIDYGKIDKSLRGYFPV
ncbi:TPA: hypothetical protein DCX16_06140 [bacterium]|nr:hypothetical protein [bacterium]